MGVWRMATVTGLEQSMVLVARSMHLDSSCLVLDDLAPSTIVVTWPPHDDVRPMSTAALLDLWEAQPGRHVVRGALYLMDPATRGAAPVLLALTGPCISGAGLRWGLATPCEEGPISSGACVLVLQPPAEEAKHD